MHGIPAIVLIAPPLAGDPDGHCGGAPPALRASPLRGQHPGVELDHPPDPCPVPARTRGAAAGASAPEGPPTTPGAIPARHEGGVEGGPQPPTGQLLPDAAGTAVDHTGDDPQERARALASLDDLASAPRAGGPHARLGVAPAAAATAARGDPVWSKYSNSPSHGRLRLDHHESLGLSSTPLSSIRSVNWNGKG
jgi:hypothetical protein